MLKPVQIGKYEFRVTDVLSCTKRSGFWGWLLPGYNVILTVGIKLRLSREEKEQLDEEIAFHQEVMSAYGFAKSQGFRG